MKLNTARAEQTGGDLPLSDAQLVATALRFGSDATTTALATVLKSAPPELVAALRAAAAGAVSSGGPGNYSVLWAIDIEEVSTPAEAAAHARACQVRQGTTATVFEVLDCSSGLVSTVDLDSNGEQDVLLAAVDAPPALH